MKTLFTCSLLLAIASPVHAEKLSPVDRETLLERVEGLKEGAASRADARFKSAITAYRSAMSSDAAAIAFYLKCIEKVDFDEKEKTYVDFREWKRKNDEKNSTTAFKTALRYQLRWLVLTLQAASEDPDYDYLSREAISTLDSIMSEGDEIGQQKNILAGSVTGTVFAKAYDIDNVKADDWPKAPFPAKQIFEQIVFPPLRTTMKVSELRAAWDKYIRYEGIVAEKWTAQKAGKKLSDEAQKLRYALFLKETLPSLRWEAETDLYETGDERTAAVNMISLIEKNPYHPSVADWADSLLELLQSDLPEPGTEDFPVEETE